LGVKLISRTHDHNDLNIGVRQLKDSERVGICYCVKSGEEDEANKAVIEKALKKTFSPEFLNRID